MKTIPNLTFTIKDAATGKEATSADLLRMTLMQAPSGGFDFASMRARNRIAEALEKVSDGGEIALEDADYSAARACVEAFRWQSWHPDLLKFAEQFGL